MRSDETATEHLQVMWPAAALDLGYHTRRLWSLLQSVWAEGGEGGQPIEPALVAIHHALLALDRRLNAAELAHCRTLLASIDELQAEAYLFVGGLKTELLVNWRVQRLEDLSGYPDRIERLLPGLIEERRGGWDSKMATAWRELRLLSQRAVAGHDVLVAWWEIGFRLADVTPPSDRPGSPLVANDEGVGPIHAAIERLPAAERLGVRSTLPTVPGDDPRHAGWLREAYIGCRATLLRSATGAVLVTPEADEFAPSDDYRAVRLGNKTYTFSNMQSTMVKALHEAHLARKPGVSARMLFSVAGSNRSEQRVEHVFRHSPALADGLLEKLEGGNWRLNLNTRQKPTS